MYYQISRKKALIFKIAYLAVSALVIAYCAFVFFENLVNGFINGLNFDDIILVIATLFAILFEGSIIGFIVRSFKQPTILMKNLVFKNDGTIYKPGVALVSVGAILTLAMSVVFFLNSFALKIFDMYFRASYFILAVGLLLFANLLFTIIYFFVFRHESGTFTII